MKIYAVIMPLSIMVSMAIVGYSSFSLARGENGALGQNREHYPAKQMHDRSDNYMNYNNRNWNSENTYWRNNYTSRPYYSQRRNYSMYEPAYRYGTDMYIRNNGRSYNELDQETLRQGWAQARGRSNLNWSDAEQAVRDAYNRMYDSRYDNSANNSYNSTTR